MNWGYKILIVYTFFVVMMMGMVFVASRQTNEMQDENYYAKEVAYQTVIDGKNNLQAVGVCTITNTADAIQLQVPAAAVTAVTDGTIYFLCPSDERSDVHLKFAPDLNGQQLIPKSILKEMVYTVQVSWKESNKPYYFEQSFNVEQRR